MFANVLVDIAVGTVPVAGDLFDVAFKANHRRTNMASHRTFGSPSAGIGSTQGETRRPCVIGTSQASADIPGGTSCRLPSVCSSSWPLRSSASSRSFAGAFRAEVRVRPESS